MGLDKPGKARVGSGTVQMPDTPAAENGAARPGGWRAFLLRLLGGGGHADARQVAAAEKAHWRYAEHQELARGGMGIIYSVKDEPLQRRSAMKVALPAIVREPANAARFVTEARITALLEHPNIVPVHDFGQTPQELPYYTMKLVDGEPLSQILDRIALGDVEYSRKYDRHERLMIFRKVCDAVAYAHARNVIHRDIKPENIMVGPYGEALLMDWGLAKKTGELEASGDPIRGKLAGLGTMTSSGVIKGTPAFMSPEQARGEADGLDARTDIFLLGATLYNMMTLLPPYSGTSSEEVVSRAALGHILSPAEAAPKEQIPEELCRIILKAMAFRKNDRYASLDEMITELDNLISGRTLSQRRTFMPNEYLMRAGEKGSEGYVILYGRVEVFCEEGGRRTQLGTLGPGDVVGEMAILTDEARSANVVAIAPTEVEIITEGGMKAEMRKLAPWMGRVVNALAQRLRLANSRIHPLLSGDCSGHVAKQLVLIASRADQAAPLIARALPLHETVREIARNLAIPDSNAETALLHFAEQGLVALDPAKNECRIVETRRGDLLRRTQ